MAAKGELIQRIRELRRRHFGARGKAEFARRLEIDPEEYETYERNRIPPGDVLLRMCEATGEDLQWLLTGVAARGTLVISNTPHRHQQLLTRIAQVLERQPELASPIEAFFDLLTGADDLARRAVPRLPAPDDRDLIPVLRIDELPERLPDPSSGSGERFALRRTGDVTLRESTPARLVEPDIVRDGAASGIHDRRGAQPASTGATTSLVEALDGKSSRRFVLAPSVARCFPSAFAIEAPESSEAPTAQRLGEVLLVAPDLPAVIGRTAVCHARRPHGVVCGAWLGEDGQSVMLGGLAGWESDEPRRIPRADLFWALELLYRVAANN